MKNKSIFTLIGLVLFCACAVAQESQQAATASAPYAGATISDFKGKSQHSASRAGICRACSRRNTAAGYNREH